MDNFKNPSTQLGINKTLPTKSRERNKESCEHSRRIVGIPVVLKPIVVPVPLAVVPIKAKNVAVAIRTANILYKAPSMSPPLEYSWSCIVFGI